VGILAREPLKSRQRSASLGAERREPVAPRLIPGALASYNSGLRYISGLLLSRNIVGCDILPGMLSTMRHSSRSQSLLIFNAAILLVLAGCAAPRQSRFQMPFVAPARVTPDVVLAADPPALPPNIYLSRETPTFIPGQSRLTPLPTPSDLLMGRADDAFLKGKRRGKRKSAQTV